MGTGGLWCDDEYVAPGGSPPSTSVVVVDDSTRFRQAVKAVLDRVAGFELVAEAESGEEGVELVDRLRPDLVLMDINMAGISGIEATRRITAAHPEVRVILLSTYQVDDLPVEVLQSGATAYLHKEDLSGRTLRRLWEQASSSRDQTTATYG